MLQMEEFLYIFVGTKDQYGFLCPEYMFRFWQGFQLFLVFYGQNTEMVFLPDGKLNDRFPDPGGRNRCLINRVLAGELNVIKHIIGAVFDC